MSRPTARVCILPPAIAHRSFPLVACLVTLAACFLPCPTLRSGFRAWVTATRGCRLGLAKVPLVQAGSPRRGDAASAIGFLAPVACDRCSSRWALGLMHYSLVRRCFGPAVIRSPFPFCVAPRPPGARAPRGVFEVASQNKGFRGAGGGLGVGAVRAGGEFPLSIDAGSLQPLRR